jgi:two-component system response regulator RegA
MSLRLMVVDDDAIYRERLVRAFIARGHDTRGAGDGESALTLLAEFAPECAVLDLKMPGKDGLNVLRELLAAQSGLRAVVLTGYGSIATALEAVRLGAVDYLTKPADADQILTALAQPGRSFAGAEAAVPSLDRVEWEHIQRVLTECGGNISKAARLLGLHRRSLQRKLEKWPPGR